MDRMKQVAIAAREPVRRKADLEKRFILEAMKTYQGQLKNGMVETLNTVFYAAANQQSSGSKGEIFYICFSFQKDNLPLNRYAIRADARDSRFYRDLHEASADWDFSILLHNIDSDFSSIESAVRKSVAQVQAHELEEVRQVYMMHHYAMAMDYLREIVPACLKQVQVAPALTAPAVKCTIGPYMGQQHAFHTWRPNV